MDDAMVARTPLDRTWPSGFAQGQHELLNVAPVELGKTSCNPGTTIWKVRWRDLPGEAVQVLTCVVQVDDLDG